MRPSTITTLLVLIGFAAAIHAQEGKASFPKFRTQEFEKGFEVGYAVRLVDVNGDKKTDIVVVDSARVVWYENPTWKLHTIIKGQTKPDNVCIAPHDINGDGKLDFALGADWAPINTKSGGTLQWLKQGKSPYEPFSLHPIAEEPTIHRIHFGDVLGEGKPQLLSAPLMGRDSSRAKNWLDGQPVRIIAYKIPKEPSKDRWAPVVVDQSLHVVHNFWPIPSSKGSRKNLLAASYEGLSFLAPDSAGKWQRKLLSAGNQDTPKGRRGASEVKQGKLKNGRKLISTIEPWHGFQVVLYTEPTDKNGKWKRHVLDDQLKWGHGVWFADLDNDGNDELIIGVRDNLSKKPNQQRGVRIYKMVDANGDKWARRIIDDGGVAVEDISAADLNGDGKVDIVAVGRQTGNGRIYWNEGK